MTVRTNREMLAVGQRGLARQDHWPIRLSRDLRNLAAALQQADRLLVETHENLATEPLALVSDNAIGIVTARVEHCQSSLDGLAVKPHVSSIDAHPQGTCNHGCQQLVGPLEHSAELAQRGQTDCYDLCLLHKTLGECALARVRTSPPGNVSKLNRSPGWAPRCSSNFSRKVTCPSALMVKAFIARILSLQNVSGNRLACKGRDVRPDPHHPRRPRRFSRLALTRTVTILALTACQTTPAIAQEPATDAARRAAVHPVSDAATLHRWLARVPVTRQFPEDFAATLRGHGPAFVIEMTTDAGCLPCGDLWRKLSLLSARYGWQLRAIGSDEAMIRSGRLALPWVGHPVAWVRPASDPMRSVPIAIGTDHASNLARNLYLAAKMLTGVRPAVGVRALSKFTGIVAPAPAHPYGRRP